jgi:hypothetical protein
MVKYYLAGIIGIAIIGYIGLQGIEVLATGFHIHVSYGEF